MTSGMIRIAREKEKDERIFRQWLANFTPMSISGKFKSYEDYKYDLSGGAIDTRPTEEIVKEAEDIEKRMKTNGNGNL